MQPPDKPVTQEEMLDLVVKYENEKMIILPGGDTGVCKGCGTVIMGGWWRCFASASDPAANSEQTCQFLGYIFVPFCPNCDPPDGFGKDAGAYSVPVFVTR